MKPPLRVFKIEGISNTEYLDAEFSDCCNKGPLRAWWISRDEQGEWYGIMRRAKTEDSSFDDGHIIPVALARYLGAIVEQRMESES